MITSLFTCFKMSISINKSDGPNMYEIKRLLTMSFPTIDNLNAHYDATSFNDTDHVFDLHSPEPNITCKECNTLINGSYIKCSDQDNKPFYLCENEFQDLTFYTQK